jgi:hypothetical protein
MNTLQQAALRRKVLYFAILLGLFTLSMFWRGTIPIPLASTARAGEPPSGLHRLADTINNRTILNQAIGLELRELEQGDPEITGSAVRLLLVGSRGLVVTALWQAAIEKQKRNDFHELELLVRQVTKLQPHFITPWIFQSWNIAYNVSVEMQGSGDMYFYIARGIELLAEGERRNHKSPDMRYQIAFYYQNKFGVSDNVEVLRCLFQLSCIPPDERNPEAGGLTNADGTVNLVAFRAFCEKYPHLIRRLRGQDIRASAADEETRRQVEEALKCRTPAEVIQFLRDNKDVPSRYKYGSTLADVDRQFPVLPPQFNEGPEEAHPGMITKDDFSAFKAARAWFTYSLVPLPPNQTDEEGNPMPARTPLPGEYDPIKYRIPRQPMLIIFRQGAPRVQSAQAEMEQREGWFDDEGWRIDDPKDEPQNWWFPDPDAPANNPRPLDIVIGKERPWSLEEWGLAARMWRKHGETYGLLLPRARLARFEELARQAPGGGLPLEPTREEFRQPWFQATLALLTYRQNRDLTNFPFFLAAAEAEAKPITVQARKLLWKAEQARKLGDKRLAIRLYEGETDAQGNVIQKGGLELWKEVLMANRDFHRPERSERTEEQTYEYELAYLRLLVQDDARVRSNNDPDRPGANQVARGLKAIIPFLPDPFPVATPQWSKDAREDLKWSVAEKYFSPFAGLMDVNDDRKGTAWIRSDVKESVRAAQGVQRLRGQPNLQPIGPLTPIPPPTPVGPGGN